MDLGPGCHRIPGSDRECVDLLIDRLHRFSSETRKLLSLAACIGNTFDLESLERISGAGAGSSMRTCCRPLRPGDPRFFRVPEPDDPTAGASTEGGSYKFLHDRVQQAAYAIIAEKEKQPGPSSNRSDPAQAIRSRKK